MEDFYNYFEKHQNSKDQRQLLIRGKQFFDQIKQTIGKKFCENCELVLSTLDYRIAVGLRLFIISTFSQGYALIR